MTGRDWRPCDSYREVLLDFADARDRSLVPALALDHFDRCRTCQIEFTEVAVTVNALRRVAEGIVDAEPSPRAWPAVLAEARRIQTGGRKRRLRWPRIGPALAGSLAAVAILTGSVAIGPPVGEKPVAPAVTLPRLEFSTALGDPVLLRGRPAVAPEIPPSTHMSAVAARWVPPDGSAIDEVAPAEPVHTVTRAVQRL